MVAACVRVVAVGLEWEGEGDTCATTLLAHLQALMPAEFAGHGDDCNSQADAV